MAYGAIPSARNLCSEDPNAASIGLHPEAKADTRERWLSAAPRSHSSRDIEHPKTDAQRSEARLAASKEASTSSLVGAPQAIAGGRRGD